jgi:hypothetical protein
MLQTGTPGAGMFLSPVPEPPGDPAALTGAAARYTAVQGELERNRAALASIKAEAIQVQWTGVGAYSFGDVTAELTAAYFRTADAYAKAAVAMRVYATDLATAQETARHANVTIAESNSLATAVLNAQKAATQDQATAAAAGQAAATAEAQAAANPHLPPVRLAADTARRTASDAQITASNAWIKVTNLTGQYGTAHDRATTLAAEAHTQAATAAAKAAAAFDAVTGYATGQQTQPARGGATGKPAHHSSNFFDSAVHFVEHKAEALASTASAVISHPGDVAQTVGGIGITTLSVVGGGGLATLLEATGVGAPAGVLLDEGAADGAATGTDMAVTGATKIVEDATTAEGAGSSADSAVAEAKKIQEIVRPGGEPIGEPGNPCVQLVNSQEELQQVWGEMKNALGRSPDRVIDTPKGPIYHYDLGNDNIVQYRTFSKTGMLNKTVGDTIDIIIDGEPIEKIHIKP